MGYFTGSKNVFRRLVFKLRNIFHGVAFLDGVAFLRGFFRKKEEEGREKRERERERERCGGQML